MSEPRVGTPFLFLSHAGADTEAARKLKKRIEAAPAAREQVESPTPASMLTRFAPVPPRRFCLTCYPDGNRNRVRSEPSKTCWLARPAIVTVATNRRRFSDLTALRI